jgi:hypothetical protein
VAIQSDGKHEFLKSPRDIYVLGTAGNALSGGMYLAGFPIFLWTLLASHPGLVQRIGVISSIFAFKYLLEGLLDIITSVICDVKRWRSRRAMFVSGAGSQVVGMCLLAEAARLATDHPWMSVATVVLAEVCRTYGNASISGTFDGWAVTLEKSADQDFQRTPMFARTSTLTRGVLLLGSLVALALLSLQHDNLMVVTGFARQPLNAVVNAASWLSNFGLAAKVWVVYWFIAALLQSMVFYLISFASKQFPEIDPAATSSISSVFKLALNRSSLGGLIIQGSWYTIIQLVSYTWPVLLRLTIHVDAMRLLRYAIVPSLLVVGFLGARTTLRLANEYGDTYMFDYARRWSLLTAFLVVTAATCFLIFGQSGNDQLSITSLLPILILVAARYPQYASEPYIQSLVHARIGAENIRAAVVSTRTGITNILAGLMIASAGFLATHFRFQDHHQAEGKAIAVVLLAISLVILALIASMRTRQVANHAVNNQTDDVSLNAGGE